MPVVRRGVPGDKTGRPRQTVLPRGLPSRIPFRRSALGAERRRRGVAVGRRFEGRWASVHACEGIDQTDGFHAGGFVPALAQGANAEQLNFLC